MKSTNANDAAGFSCLLPKILMVPSEDSGLNSVLGGLCDGVSEGYGCVMVQYYPSAGGLLLLSYHCF